jgi:hypothetical protein
VLRPRPVALYPEMPVKTVIFACVQNAGRSQMAAAFFNQLAKNARAISAGTQPADLVHPEEVRRIRDDIRDRVSALIAAEGWI